MSSAAPDEPRVPAADRVRIARRAAAWLAVPAAVGVALTIALLGSGRRAEGLGVALGVGAGLLLTATWVVGALATFHRRGDVLLLATLGLWPLRVAFLVVVASIGTILGADPFALIVSLVATHVYGHLAEAQALGALADAARPMRDVDRRPGGDKIGAR